MGEGIFAELRVSGPASCWLLTANGGTEPDATIGNVTRGATADEEETITEEFTVESANDGTCEENALLEGIGGSDGVEDPTRVFDAGPGTVYRFDREQRGCACDRIEAMGCPVRDVVIRGDRIVLSFFAPDVGTLREVITDLGDRFDAVSVERLLRSDPEESGSDLAFVDRSALTDRQREVLSVAHEMGYFDHPRDANAEAVAAELDITHSTFAEHLAAAQSKLLDTILECRA